MKRFIRVYGSGSGSVRHSGFQFKWGRKKDLWSISLVASSTSGEGSILINWNYWSFFTAVPSTRNAQLLPTQCRCQIAFAHCRWRCCYLAICFFRKRNHCLRCYHVTSSYITPEHCVQLSGSIRKLGTWESSHEKDKSKKLGIELTKYILQVYFEIKKSFKALNFATTMNRPAKFIWCKILF